MTLGKDLKDVKKQATQGLGRMVCHAEGMSLKPGGISELGLLREGQRRLGNVEPQGRRFKRGMTDSQVGASALTSTLFFFQRQAKYSENKLKCTKARNDYLLNLAATNAAISKYYIHDVSDLIDVSTWGVWDETGPHTWAGPCLKLKCLSLEP